MEGWFSFSQKEKKKKKKEEAQMIQWLAAGHLVIQRKRWWKSDSANTFSKRDGHLNIYCMALHACGYAYDVAGTRHKPSTVSHWPHPQWEQEGVCQCTQSVLRMNKQTLTITCQGLNLCVQEKERREKGSWSLLLCPIWTGRGNSKKGESESHSVCPTLWDPMDRILQARILE